MAANEPTPENAGRDGSFYPKAERKRVREFPEWLRKPWPATYDTRTQEILAGLKLNTVCQSAECPNLGECWNRGAATFMILGESCTRSCNFCAVKTGRGEALEKLADEPQRVAEATKQLGLKHVVVTSVARDDLKDEGAGHFARVIEALRAACGPGLIIEVLVPDFHAREDCLRIVVEARPNVFNHNTETIERLHSPVRPQGNYRRSLEVLSTVKRLDAKAVTKSGLMVGLGETQEEVRLTLRELREAGCEILTIGQYLRPSPQHLPVAEFVHPDTFKAYERYALELGYKAAACGPFVRSSYQAEQVLAGAKH
ncbi:MAG: lipoyl synthase [Planctomycetes bacterium]|nr:lipoyl synthase [Planctomycetota bacterium]